MGAPPCPRPLRLLAAAGLLLALGPPPPLRASEPPQVQPSLPKPQLPAPPPLNPAGAFDPAGPFLPGSPPPALLLPGGRAETRFNPGAANQPEAVSGPRPPIPPCRLIVPVKDYALQPLHIAPAQVPLKNSFGCLSAADAVYGPDGCPKRLCGKGGATQILLPPGGP